jgi:hypothetical protein
VAAFRKFGRAFACAMILLLAFVVVCPTTPTPIGVLHKGKMPVVAIVVLLLPQIAISIPTLNLPAVSCEGESPVRDHLPLLDLICCLLC